jgi:FkbM family methyltransferase
MITLYHLIGRLLRHIPKIKHIKTRNMDARFFVPINCHYICDDLNDIKKGAREPELYTWLSGLPEGAILFDIGTSYGQESALSSSLHGNKIAVIGFDCSLYQSHFCCLNKSLNGDRYRFIFAAVSDKTGHMVSITANSDTHIPHLHKKNLPYHYEVMTLALDDFAKRENLFPTHIKIDVDGAEFSVLRGALAILKSETIKDVFIEIDHQNLDILGFMEDLGFSVEWRITKDLNDDVLFRKN